MVVISPVQVRQLTENWRWKERDSNCEDLLQELKYAYSDAQAIDERKVPATRDTIKNTWFPASTFPSEIHVELLKQNVIPHPYVRFNEHDVQWVSDTEWLYSCTFPLDISNLNGATLAQLTFDGLDTLCDVYLNGCKVLQTDNMFRQYTYQLPLGSSMNSPALQAENTLLLYFRCAKAYAKAQEAVYGKVRAGSTNLGDPSRVYLRKAQYDWRWDWGPELMTCGPYRGISLTIYTVRIEEVYSKASLQVLSASEGSSSRTFLPSLSLDLKLTGSSPAISNLQEYQVEVSLKDPGNGATIKSEHLSLTGHSVSTLRTIFWTDLSGLVEPWWPVGWGQQNLYDLEVRLVAPGGVIIDSETKRIGFRSIELVQNLIEEPDQYGTGSTFFFRVNGAKIFMGGSNWIPADNFLTTIAEDRYRKWLTLLRNGNQNMVRIWGGGIYEPDIFYDVCDELGILVWQDFQFACGVYPAHEQFVESVRKEAEYNVKRLRHHPSIALFCGNNEDYQMVHQWGDVPHLPATLIYEHVLPEVVESLTDPVIPYHRGSPYGGKGWDTSDPTIGDVHQWNIWGGKELPYQEYHKLGGRFVSEFGMPSMPSMKTINYWMEGADPAERYAQSRLMAQHTRAGSFERRFAIAMNENFRLTSDFEKHVFNTQVMQSDAVGYAYQVWKREWRGDGKEYCSGVLVWQFNDCWPVVSWALVDYFLRPKPVYYTVARRLALITVNIVREVIQNRDNDRPQQFYEYGAIRSLSAKLHIWATNSTASATRLKLDIQYFDLNSTWHDHDPLNPSFFSNDANYQDTGFLLKPNQTQELTAVVCQSPPGKLSGTVVVSARLLDPNTGEVVARCADWPQPYRLLHIPDDADGLGLSIERSRAEDADGQSIIRVAVRRPVKCLFLTTEESDPSKEVQWSDNALDMIPGDDQVICAKGLGDQEIKILYLRD